MFITNKLIIFKIWTDKYMHLYFLSAFGTPILTVNMIPITCSMIFGIDFWKYNEVTPHQNYPCQIVHLSILVSNTAGYLMSIKTLNLNLHCDSLMLVA